MNHAENQISILGRLEARHATLTAESARIAVELESLADAILAAQAQICGQMREQLESDIAADTTPIPFPTASENR